jgi:hypothetical protein
MALQARQAPRQLAPELLVQHVVQHTPLVAGAAKESRSQFQVAQHLSKTIWLRGGPSAKRIAAAKHGGSIQLQPMALQARQTTRHLALEHVVVEVRQACVLQARFSP